MAHQLTRLLQFLKSVKTLNVNPQCLFKILRQLLYQSIFFMDKTIQYEGEHYDELVARQVEQYRETAEMHDLPPIFHYWSSKYLGPNFYSLTGYDNHIDFYASYFQRSLQVTKSNVLLTIGSGYCSM